MKLTLLWLFLGFTTLAAAEEAPRLAIVADSSARAEADLLTAALSQQPMVLLERGEIDRILAERRLVLEGLAQGELVGLGQLLRADGVVFARQGGAG